MERRAMARGSEVANLREVELRKGLVQQFHKKDNIMESLILAQNERWRRG